MGSGELTTTMVEVHKELLRKLGSAPRAAFLDTPAGFQLNVDQISQKAVEYFRSRVERPMSVASFKSKETSTPYEAEQAFHTLRNSDFILIGPGSPTYAVRQWLQTPIPEILTKRVENGGCLVAASAAALTVGRFTPAGVRDLQGRPGDPLGGGDGYPRPFRPQPGCRAPLEQRRGRKLTIQGFASWVKRASGSWKHFYQETSEFWVWMSTRPVSSTSREKRP